MYAHLCPDALLVSNLPARVSSVARTRNVNVRLCSGSVAGSDECPLCLSMASGMSVYVQSVIEVLTRARHMS